MCAQFSVLSTAASRVTSCPGRLAEPVERREHVLYGWSPCRCGGHHTVYCRDDVGGCGYTHHDPPIIEGYCRLPSFGWQGAPPVPH